MPELQSFLSATVHFLPQLSLNMGVSRALKFPVLGRTKQAVSSSGVSSE